MLKDQVGPFAQATTFAENFINSLVLNASIYELMEWMETVELGISDPNIPAELKHQVRVDYAQIQEHFNKLSKLIARG